MTDDVVTAKIVERASVAYKVGHHVVIDTYDGFLTFGRIELCIQTVNGSEWLIVVQELKTDYFDTNFHSYVVDVCVPVSYRIVSFDDLIDYHPVCLYKKVHKSGTTCFVRLQYQIFKD